MNTEELLKLLACPACRNSLQFAKSGEKRAFICPHCEVAYPVRDGIPIMLVEEAIPMRDWTKDNPCAC